MAVEQAQAGAHHQGVGLAAEIGLFAGGQLDGGHQSAAGGGDAALDRAGHVGVGPDELGTLIHQVGGLGQGVQGVGPALAHHHIVGVHVVHGDARVVQGVEQACLADGEDGTAGGLLLQKGRCGQGAGVEVVLRHVQAQTGQLLMELPGGVAAVVGQEQELLLLVVEPLDKLCHAGQDPVAVIDDAVHIADEAALGVEIDVRHSSS